MDVAGAVAARLTGRPYVYSERTVVLEGKTWRDRVRHRFIDGATAIVANSEAGAAYWRRRPARSASTYVVRNGLPTGELDRQQAAPRGPLGVPQAAELILFAGRMDVLKNIPGLAQVLGIVLERRPTAFAVCCGIGPEVTVLQREIARRGLDGRLLLLGYRTDIWALMKAADVFISTSHHEGHPNAVLEAMACGTPLVLSDIEQHRECVPSDAALFFPADDAEAGAAAIGQVLDDRRATQERTTRARRTAERLSIDSMARQYEAIYERLLIAGAGETSSETPSPPTP
jgi:glycosyltransferase involved in cell wall biosynthesis